MSEFWTQSFWRDVAERFVRAFAAAMVLTMPVADAVSGGDRLSLPDMLLGALVQGLGAVLLSLVGSQVGDKGTTHILPQRRKKVHTD